MQRWMPGFSNLRYTLTRPRLRTNQGADFGAHLEQDRFTDTRFANRPASAPVKALDLIGENSARWLLRHYHLEGIALDLRGHHAENRRIGPGLRESQIDQLEHRLEILPRT